MPSDRDKLLPGPVSDVDWYEKRLTKGDNLVGYVWYKGRKISVHPKQTIIRISTLSVNPMRGKNE